MRTTVAVIATVLAAPGLGQAQILESAERLIAETAMQEIGGSRRSMARTWIGVGLAAGGAVVALMRQDCRVAGTLSDESAVHISLINSAGSVGVVFDNARQPTATKVDGRCDFDWTVDGTPVLLSIFGDRVGTTTADKASELRSDFPEVAETQGSARAEKYRPKGLLYGGLGMAAAGALLAVLWSDVPVMRDVSVSPTRGGVAIGSQIGF